jgi:hypothetical protein
MEVYILSPTPKLVLKQPPLGRGENIESFIEEQAFSLLYALAPPSLPTVSKLSLFRSLPVCRRKSLLDERGGGGVYGKV